MTTPDRATMEALDRMRERAKELEAERAAFLQDTRWDIANIRYAIQRMEKRAERKEHLLQAIYDEVTEILP